MSSFPHTGLHPYGPALQQYIDERAEVVYDAVAEELAAYQPGLEVGYAERTSTATSSQTAPNATGAISGLSATVTGKGRPVDIRYECPALWCSVANKFAYAAIGVNGVYSGASVGRASASVSTGPSGAVTRRLVLTDGVVYTFTVALYMEAGGTLAGALGQASLPMSLSVVNR